jgi:hypothetical protein
VHLGYFPLKGIYDEDAVKAGRAYEAAALGRKNVKAGLTSAVVTP